MVLVKMSIWDQVECPYCDPNDYDNYEVFSSSEELAKHRDKIHPGKPIYLCVACEKSFHDWHEATEHVHWDHDEYCDECQRGYLYEAICISPESKERISEIHDKISELKEELEKLCATPVPISEVSPQTLLI